MARILRMIHERNAFDRLACDRSGIIDPARRLAEAARAKIEACCHSLPDRGAALWQVVMALETAADSADLARP